MRTKDQITRMLNQLSQMKERLNEIENKQELEVLYAKIEMLEWVLNQPTGSYHL